MDIAPDTPAKKISKTWGATAAIVVAILSYLISQIGISLIVVISDSFPGFDITEDTFNTPWVSLGLAAISSAIMLLVLWLFLRARHISIKSMGFHKPDTKGIGIMLLGYGIYYLILVISFVLIVAFLPEFNTNEVQDIGYDGVAGWQLVLAFIGLVIIPPITEEIFFRGFLYKGLANSWPKWLAALTASLLFALAHMQWNVGVDVFILSLILIYIYEKTGNLWLCIGLHGLKNFVAFLALFVLT